MEWKQRVLIARWLYQHFATDPELTADFAGIDRRLINDVLGIDTPKDPLIGATVIYRGQKGYVHEVIYPNDKMLIGVYRHGPHLRYIGFISPTEVTYAD